MNKKAAIVTWIGYPNYGTYLQAFALKRTLQKLGLSVKFIDDSNVISEYHKENQSYLKKCLAFIKSVIIGILKFSDDNSKRKFKAIDKRFLEFKKDFLPISTESESFDIYIAGSDQIWSPQYPLSPHYFSHYFLQNFKGTKIAYAPSLGMQEDMYPEYAKLVYPWLNEFKLISAREPEGAKILSNITGRENIPTVLDPTLLISKEEWINSFGLKQTDNSNICLLYLLSYNKIYIEETRRYASSHNLTLKIIPTNRRTFELPETKIICGPIEFLNSILNCEVFFTDSFHGSIFASIFGKKYVVYKRFSESEKNNQNLRILNLFSIIDPQRKFIDCKLTPLKENDIRATDISSSNLREWTNKSLDYLNESINDNSNIK